MKKLVDTNVIIRLLQKDGTAEQFAQAKKWFLQAEQKEISLKIPTIVVAETCYVLESFYLHDRPTIVATMSVLLSQSWIEVPGRTILQNSWRWYMQGFHFVDSMLLSEAEYKNYDIATFDKKVATAVKGFELSKAY
ncbi:MAG: PIN domain-containing protein [Pseudomonadales bacterium]|nr:PIN domain-containing protein [Pseudomonadales bacterium]